MPTASRGIGVWVLTLACVTSPALAAPDYWDPRLDQICQLALIDIESQVPQGQGYWRLSEARFEDEDEARGTRHIYVRCQIGDGPSDFIEGKEFFAAWPYGNTTVDESVCVTPNWACADTKGPGIDSYYGNYPMSGDNCPPGNCGWPYTAFVGETTGPPGFVGPSDKVIGMGMHNPSGTPCAAHVSYRLTFKWTEAVPQEPTISRSPSSFSHTITVGDNQSDDTFTVSNSGGGTLEYTISDNVGWLSVNPDTGSSTGQANTITIDYVTAGLGVDTHNATITISDPDATNNPQAIAVSVTVEPITVPGDFDGDGDVDQADFGVFQACLTGAGISQDDPACAGAKLDTDIDVDQDDFAIFQGCLSGPDNPGDPDCAD